MRIDVTPTLDNSRLAHVNIHIDVITLRALQKTLAATFDYTAVEAQAIHDFSCMLGQFKIPHLFVT